jgi:acetolactate synthase-1/2/3 large subunit
MQTLTEVLDEGAIVVTGNGTASVALFQAGIVKERQRTLWNSGCASMGYDLPAAVGACVGSAGNPVVCLAGDGSLQMNIQELQTLSHHRFPIKLFVLNNGGYVSIRQTQDSFFESRHVACGPSSGVTFPDICRVAAAYGIPSAVIANQTDLKERIDDVLTTPGPVVCEVILSSEQNFSPRVSSKKEPDGRIVSKPLENMYPFLDRKELQDNLLFPTEEV